LIDFCGDITALDFNRFAVRFCLHELIALKMASKVKYSIKSHKKMAGVAGLEPVTIPMFSMVKPPCPHK
jgi:hypothetical protein